MAGGSEPNSGSSQALSDLLWCTEWHTPRQPSAVINGKARIWIKSSDHVLLKGFFIVLVSVEVKALKFLPWYLSVAPSLFHLMQLV